MSDKTKSILLVEDNPIAARAAQRIFEQLGCKVDHIDDGDKAVKLALASHYNGICMDIGLINVSGVEACQAIRAYESNNQLKPVPIIALTANNASEEIADYLSVGMQAVLTKPLTKEKAEQLLSFCN